MIRLRGVADQVDNSCQTDNFGFNIKDGLYVLEKCIVRLLCKNGHYGLLYAANYSYLLVLLILVALISLY